MSAGTDEVMCEELWEGPARLAFTLPLAGPLGAAILALMFIASAG